MPNKIAGRDKVSGGSVPSGTVPPPSTRRRHRRADPALFIRPRRECLVAVVAANERSEYPHLSTSKERRGALVPPYRLNDRPPASPVLSDIRTATVAARL